MKKDPRPRIALLGMGILGGGPLGQGIPVITDLFTRLSSFYEIVFYSFNTVELSQVPFTIRVEQLNRWKAPGRLKYFILALRLIINHIRSPYDLLFAVAAYPTGMYAVILGKLLRRPVIVQYIALEAVCLREISSGNLCHCKLKKITKWVSEKSTSLVMISDYQKKIAEQSLPTTRNIEVLPLRIDHQNFRFEKRQITFPVQFIHVAYYSPIKDQLTLFRAFAEITKDIDCHLTIVGSGFNTPEVTELLNDLNLINHVTFKGPLPYSQIPAQFNQAHILIHTSLFESLCVVMQEAMASGVAVCGTNVGMLADIGSQLAVIVPPKNYSQLAKKIIGLVKDQIAYDKITYEAYQWITFNGAAWASENYRAFIDTQLSGMNSKNTIK